MKRSPLFIICVIALVDLSSFGLIIPLLPTYAHRFGASATLLGMMIGTYSLAQFLCAPLLGRWSDRIGRRPVLMLSMAGSIVSHALLGVADLAQSIPLLFLARALDGVTGANIATAQAYIADVTSGQQRARGMGLFGAMLGLGFVVGPAVGGILMNIGVHVAGESGTAWPAFGAAVISAWAFLMVVFYLPEAPEHHRHEDLPGSRRLLSGLPRVIRNDRVRELLVLFLLLTTPFVMLETTFVLLCQQRFGVTDHGAIYVFVYFGILIIVVRGGVVGRLVKRLGEPAVISLGPFVTAFGFLGIGGTEFQPALLLLMLACVPVAFGNGITEPAMHSLLSRQADRTAKGLTLGVASGLTSLVRGVIPPLAGWIYDCNQSMPYWLGSALFVLAGLFAITIRARQQASLGQRLADERTLEQGAHAADR